MRASILYSMWGYAEGNEIAIAIAVVVIVLAGIGYVVRRMLGGR